MVDSIQNQITHLNTNINELTAELTAIRRAIPTIVSDTQRAAAVDAANALQGQIAALSTLLANLQANQPKLAPPNGNHASEANFGASKVGTSNPWMAPSAILAFISVMQYVLKQSALYAAMEGQNTAKGMTVQLELGNQEAELLRKQGKLELTKGIIGAGADIAGGAVAMKGVASRTKAIKSGQAQSSEGKAASKRVDEHADTQIAANSAKRQKLMAQNEATQKRLNPDKEDQVGDKPVKPDVNAKRRADLEGKVKKRDEEIHKLNEKDIEINNQRTTAKEETLRQDLMTQEQKSRAYDHWINAASKIGDGVMNQQIKQVEANISLTRTGMDILKNFIGSATKGEAEGREGAKSAADAMNQALSAHTATYYKPRNA